ncbi:hypothetical protein ABT084_23785 [Streptomyces sp. NPDC002138]|uniref:hypothetical protein n=1 Tax=Streptomyces sp. NPDC002138 TaxID=3154410 RepID=UPI003331956E
MTRGPGVRAVPALLALLAPLWLTGCGIKPTGVVESGRPASVVVGTAPAADVLYFVAPDGRLAPTVIREGRLPLRALIVRLLAGPGAAEREAGLHTALPASAGEVTGPLSVNRNDRDQLLLRLPFLRDAELSATARSQLVCTAALAADHSARTEVVLITSDGSMAPLRCDQAR